MGKIQFYKQRTFSEVVTTTFDFIRENWRPILTYMVYILLPFSLVQALINNEFYKVSGFTGFAQAASYGYETNEVSVIIYALAMFLFNIVGMLLYYSLVFTLIELYNRRVDGLSGIGWSDIRPILWPFFRKALAISLVISLGIFIIGLVMALFVVVSPWTLVATIPAIIAVLIPLTFAYPGYLYTKDKLLGSLSHSFALGWRCWLSIFGVSLLTGLLSGVLQTITSMPFQLTFLFNAITASNGSSESMSPMMSFLFYLFGVLQTFGAYIASTISPLSVSYRYAHAKEKYDGVTVESDIENFDRLGEREQNKEQQGDLFI